MNMEIDQRFRNGPVPKADADTEHAPKFDMFDMSGPNDLGDAIVEQVKESQTHDPEQAKTAKIERVKAELAKMFDGLENT